jgi:SAM-dependent methyltransferase
MTETYVREAKKNGHFSAEIGNAESLPFPDGSFDCIVMEQVLEHLVDPNNAFKEMYRVLKPGGIFFVGVPDAENYSHYEYFDFYWLLMREHIHHFDAAHLRILGERNGFAMESSEHFAHQVMSNIMVMPDVYAVLKKGGISDKGASESMELRKSMKAYVETETTRLKEHRFEFEKAAIDGNPVYVWGVGREFMYLLENAGIEKCKVAAFIDKNPLKRQTMKFNGMVVSDESALNGADSNSILVITAIAHTEAIERSVRKNGFNGKIVKFTK